MIDFHYEVCCSIPQKKKLISAFRHAQALVFIFISRASMSSETLHQLASE